MRLLYFGYPIDQNRSSQAKDVIGDVRAELVAAGAPFYDPGRALTGLKDVEPGHEIWSINHRALTVASAALFILPAGVPTIGVPREIQIAAHAGMPVAVLTDQASWSLGVSQRERVYYLTPEAVPEALAWLENQDYYGRESRRTVLPVRIEAVGGKLPARHYADDAGLDLYVSEDVQIPSGQFRDVPTGISIELPSHTWGLIKSRSSTLRSKGLLVHDGVIDPGWRGELFAGVWNLGEKAARVKAGDRIAQLILFSNVTAMYEPGEVLELTPSARGRNGFGSTGG